MRWDLRVFVHVGGTKNPIPSLVPPLGNPLVDDYQVVGPTSNYSWDLE